MGVRGREHESLDEGSIDTDPVRAWFLVPGAWKVHGFLVPGATFRGLQPRALRRFAGFAPSTRNQAPSTNEAPRTRHDRALIRNSSVRREPA
jgi:hypothetical protein